MFLFFVIWFKAIVTAGFIWPPVNGAATDSAKKKKQLMYKSEDGSFILSFIGWW